MIDLTASNGLIGQPKRGSEIIPAKILLVDDDARNLLVLQEILQAPGCELVSVQSGQEALRRVLRDEFAVVLLDVQMPGMDGYEVASLIRGRPRSSRLPIIFLTAFNKDDLHVSRGYSAGAVDYVFKPIDPVVLQSKVSVFVELYRKTEEIRLHAEHERQLLLENLRVRGEKLEAERALRQSEEHQSLILRSLPISLYTARPDCARCLQFAGNSVEDLTGFPPGAFQDQEFWATHVHSEDRDSALAQLGGWDHDETLTLQYRWCRPDGSHRHVLDQAIMVRDESGNAREIFGIWLDITERKQLEQNLLHASKIEALGRLTGGIAHDFNNMLSVVIGNLDLLKKAVGENDIARKRANMALDGAQRCAELTGRLLSFARRQPLKSSRVNLEKLTPSLVEMLERTLGDNIELKFHPEPGLWPIAVDQSQLEAAIVNLAVNSRDAMPGGGQLVIRMANLAAGDPDLPAGLRTDCVLIAVTDTGSGMPEDVRERVFEPFYTTKDIGRGTGLGLSMTHGFVKQSGGDIAVRSAPGQGTTILLYLPRAAGADEEELTDSPDPEAAVGRGELVLVVEDDDEVRRVTISTLQMLGYKTIAAENGEAAIALLKSTPGIRLVFSDVQMPGGKSGLDLVAEIRRDWPHVPVLLASGYLEMEPPADSPEVLIKPYRADDLGRRVRALLDAPRVGEVGQLARSA